ncbi:hypothetical protein, partial [Candidatus Aquicultor secundus]
ALGILSLVVGQLLQAKLFTGKLNAKEIADNTMDIALNGLRSRHED